MALDRRTLRTLMAAPVLDHRSARVTVLLLATGSAWRITLHALGVAVPEAERRSADHLVIGAGSDVEIHIVGVPDEDREHPVTRQLAGRAQGVLAAPSIPPACIALPTENVTRGHVEAYRSILTRILDNLDTMQDGAAPPSARLDDVAPLSTGDMQCKLGLLAVHSLTAVEILTALDDVMTEQGFVRSRHAGGGQDFLLLRGRLGAGLRVLGDTPKHATPLAIEVAKVLNKPMLVAIIEATRTFDDNRGQIVVHYQWRLESVSKTGVGAACIDEKKETSTIEGSVAELLPLDEAATQFIAKEVFRIAPEPDPFPVHFELIDSTR